MKLSSKIKFQWREPKAFVAIKNKMEAKKQKWWYPIITFTVVVALTLILRHFALLTGKIPAPLDISILLAVSLGLFLAYVVPWFNKLCPTGIRITDKSISVIRGDRNNIYKWNKIKSFNFNKIQDMNILELVHKNRYVTKLAIDESIQINELEDYLNNTGLAKEQ